MSPTRPPAAYVRGYADRGSLGVFTAMMRRLDDGVGHVGRALHDAGLERDTFVVFTSDNGGERYSYNWPMSDGKGSLREGGIRVPAIVRWPGRVPAGRTTDQSTITMDWTATLLAVGGATPDPGYPLDGRDLSPLCRGEPARFDRTIFWRTRLEDAARRGPLEVSENRQRRVTVRHSSRSGRRCRSGRL